MNIDQPKNPVETQTTLESPKEYHDLRILYPYLRESSEGEKYYIVKIEPSPEFGREKSHLTAIDFMRVCQEIVIDISKNEELEGSNFKTRFLKEHYGEYRKEVKYPPEQEWAISLHREVLEESDEKKKYKWTFELNEGAMRGYLIGNWYYESEKV